jgi:Chalcone isomerase-like
MTPALASSNRRAWLASTLLLLAAPAWASRPIKVEGVTFPGTLTLADSALLLNGVGLRAVAWLKGYAAGLYLARRASTAPQVLAQTGPKRLQLRMLQDVEAEEFVKALVKGVERNTSDAETARLAERVARFSAQVRGLVKLRKKDVIDIDFLPGRGTLLSRNGAARGEPIGGEDFYAALLLCFIGERPADPDMKVGLLGGPVG